MERRIMEHPSRCGLAPVGRLREQPLLPLPASCAEGEASLSTRIQGVLPAGGGPQALQRRYVQAVLGRYLWLPDTPSVCSRHDRRLAREWYEQGVPLIVVEAALLLAATRRALREPYLAPLPRVRALHYFAPVVRELLEDSKDPDREYIVCLLRRLRPLAELKLARLRHNECHSDPAVADRTAEPQPDKPDRCRTENVR
jgi:hypothetical protein